MRAKLLFAVALLAVFAVWAPAAAEIKTHPTAKVQFEVPDSWKTKADGDAMAIVDPSQEMFFYFIVADAKDLNNIAAELDKRLANLVTDVKWAKPEKATVNGMPALKRKGEGKVSGTPSNIGLVLVQTPAAKVLVVLAAVETAKYPAHKDEIAKLLNSIKPAK